MGDQMDRPGPALASAIWDVNQQMENLCLSFSLSLSLCVFQIKKKKNPIKNSAALEVLNKSYFIPYVYRVNGKRELISWLDLCSNSQESHDL